MLQMLQRLLEPIRNRINLLVTKAIIKAVDNNNNIQLVKVDMGNDELITDVEHIQSFGFTSAPVDGTPALVLCINGDREHPIVIATDSETRPSVSEGDSAMYNANGTKITLQGNKVIVDGNNIELGTGTIKELVNEAFKTLYNNHGHDYIAPGGAAITGQPTTSVLPALAPAPLTSTHLTSKTKAE